MNFSNSDVPPGYCAYLRMYCLHLLSYPGSLIHLRCCAVLPARRRSCRLQLRCYEVIPESNASASIFALPRYLTMSVWSRTVGKEGLFICRTKHVMHLCEVRSERDVDSL